MLHIILLRHASKTSVITWALLFSVFTHASMPKSIKYVEELFADSDTMYVHYEVTCQNGNVIDISSWDDNKLWCAGKGKKEECNKKKIKTAKKVCK